MEKTQVTNLKNVLSPQSTISVDADLTSLTTLKLKSQGTLVTIATEDDLRNCMQFLGENKLNFRVLGWGANSLLPEEVKEVVIKLDFFFDESVFDSHQESYELPASLSLAKMTAAALRHGIKGWEVFTGVPATLGGAIAMNAGTGLGEIGSLVESIRIMQPDGSTITRVIKEGDFGYRQNNFLNNKQIILSAKIKSLGHLPKIKDDIKKYLDYRKSTQPLGIHTCGCLFTNNVDSKDQRLSYSKFRAGKSLDLCKLKGFRFKNLRMSPIHANFLENLGYSTSNDVKKFIKIIEAELEFQYGIKFVVEARL
jgi:UDP-N-acetylmuramate dehydrogenase